jgi:Pyruvate/2-oxoacid:ferredoxin oxidoreductase delta subunit
MEGDGPSSGRARKMELIMASADAVALDSCLAKIMGLEPADIRTIKEAAGIGLGESDLGRIEICGDDINAFVKTDFRLPQTTPLKILPKGLLESLAKLVVFKPFIDKDICNGCNLCKLSCPAGAIVSEKGRSRIDYASCVRCMCCYEVCPYKAISIRRNIIARWLWG